MIRFPTFFFETNYAPSQLTITPPDSGVQSRLSSEAKLEPKYDGLKIADVRELHELYKHDKIDNVGIATAQLSEKMTKHQKSELHREFTKQITAQRRK